MKHYEKQNIIPYLDTKKRNILKLDKKINEAVNKYLDTEKG